MIADVVQRLKDQVPALKLVDGALSYAAVTVQPASALLPAAYVVELSDRYVAPTGMSGAKVQAGVTTIGVILWLGVVSTATQAAPDALETLRTAVKTALFGWSPPESDGAEYAHAGGVMLYAQGNTVVWQQSFSLIREERA